MNQGRGVSILLPKKHLQLFHVLAAFFMLTFLILQSSIQAQQSWNQFRGAGGSAFISGALVPESIPEQGPQLLWAKDVGNGFPEVAVADNVAYIFSSDSLEGGYEYLAAFNASNGAEIWKTKVDSMWFEKDGWGHGPRSTPAIGENHIFCLSGCGKFAAYNKKNGKESWSVNLPNDFGSAIPRWGYSTSPVIVGEMVIIETGGTENRAFTAFNKNDGEIFWSNGKGTASYCSPAFAEIDGQPQLVFAIDTLLYGINSKGEELWQFRMPLRGPMAMPVFMEPNRFFVSSVSRTGGFVVEVNDNQPEQVFTSTTMQNNWSSSCYKDGYLYGFSRAKLQCVSAETGEMVWGKRGFGKGSLIIVDDKLLVLSDQGKLIIVEATPDEYRELASFQALEGKSWTAPSFAEGKLFVRNLEKMACYKLSK